MTRRALLGRVSIGVAAGAAAWVAPEIFITKPAAGATLSDLPPATGGGVVTGPGSSPTTPSEPTAGTRAGTGSGVFSALATTGLDLERDAELGAVLIAGGWAMQRWVSRQQAHAAKAAPEAHEAWSSDTKLREPTFSTGGGEMDLQSPQPQTRPLNRQTIRASLHQLLAALGASGSEVARTLQAAGVKGIQRDIRDCALALYLQAVVTGEMRVRSIVVRGPSILVHRTGLRPAIWLSVPDPVQSFITDFDRGHFPELLRDGESRDVKGAPAI